MLLLLVRLVLNRVSDGVCKLEKSFLQINNVPLEETKFLQLEVAHDANILRVAIRQLQLQFKINLNSPNLEGNFWVVYICLGHFPKLLLNLFRDFHAMFISTERLEADPALPLMVSVVDTFYFDPFH